MHFGTLGRNSLRGPHFRQFDFSIFKKTQLGEHLNMELRFEAYNLLNHPNFAAPNFLNDANNSFETSNAGIIGSTSTSSRQIQLGLKLVW